MELKVAENSHKLQLEARKRDENENVQRKQCLEISGIPAPPNEKPADVADHVVKLMKLVCSTNNKSAIDDAHRKMSGGIIVRFALTGKTSANLKGFPAPGNDLYINESLTLESVASDESAPGQTENFEQRGHQ